MTLPGHWSYCLEGTKFIFSYSRFTEWLQLVGTEQALQGSGHSPQSAGAQDVFGQHSQTLSLNVGWCCVEPELVFMIFVDPFQRGLFRDSVILLRQWSCSPTCCPGTDCSLLQFWLLKKKKKVYFNLRIFLCTTFLFCFVFVWQPWQPLLIIMENIGLVVITIWVWMGAEVGIACTGLSLTRYNFLLNFCVN